VLKRMWARVLFVLLTRTRMSKAQSLARLALQTLCHLRAASQSVPAPAIWDTTRTNQVLAVRLVQRIRCRLQPAPRSRPAFAN
jgi:hypothetical protein